jgi:gliding motility-associated-like protein
MKIIDEIVTVLPGVKAAFEANKTFICFETDPVQLKDQSLATGSLIYKWDFGDGMTSSEKNPVHSFNKKGNYTVKLSIESDLGCTSSLTKTAYLNVGEFSSGMQIPEVICRNTTTQIINTSAPNSTSFSWSVNGSPVYSYNRHLNHTFYQAGTYELELTNQFGECKQTVSKIVEVKELPEIAGFLVEYPKYCSFPVQVNFKDTSSAALKSEWNFNNIYYPIQVHATGKTVSYGYQYSGSNYTTLMVTDANGCKNSVQKIVTLTTPTVYIQTTDYNSTVACNMLTKKFKFTSNEEITSFTWNFGDGTTSKEAEPEKTFPIGKYTVTLDYTTSKGCQGRTQHYNLIEVLAKPKADFQSLSGTTICGNTIAQFRGIYDQNTNGYNWMINGNYVGAGDLRYQFKDTGTYTISAIGYNSGCRDTMTKKDYIKVIPSFPGLKGALNTCDGDRGTVTFSYNSLHVDKWKWDFGDGQSITLDEEKKEIAHHYTKTGTYKAVLTTTSGQCTNKDSVTIHVLLKQKPVLSSTKTTLCAEETLNFTLAGMEKSPVVSPYYNMEKFEYPDGTADQYYYYDESRIWVMPYTGTFQRINESKGAVRIITRSLYFNCTDTSNYIPLKLAGALAGFEILNNNECFNSTIRFRDTSSAENTTITSRLWNFGDGSSINVPQGGIVSHTYAQPGQYNVSLRITDATGCTSSTLSSSKYVMINGPKAAFSPSQYDAHLNSTIYFYNNTNNNNSYNTVYEWHFGDGSKSTDYYPSYTYKKPGIYEVMLVVSGPTTGCRDTARQKITIRDFNVNFNIQTSFVNSSECTSVLARFQNTSNNYTNVKWDFGDGTTSTGNNYPSHLYKEPGKYIVTLTATGYNGLVNTYIDSVIIEKNTVNIKTDLTRTCTSQDVTFSASTKNAANSLWDFGDGNIARVSESSYVHRYKMPGTYTPRIITTDEKGCKAFVEMKTTVIIDSLSVSIANLPDQICAPKEMVFQPDIQNIGGDKTSPSLVYHWNFGTGNDKDISNTTNPIFEYPQPGNYPVTLSIQSAFGCKKEVSKLMKAYQGLGAIVKGPSEICQEETATITGATKITGQPKWKWIFEDGSISSVQNPSSRKYDHAGNYSIQLIVDNNGCADTLKHALRVHPKPTVTLSQRDAILCEGASMSITAGGGTSYSWAPASGLNNTSGPVAQANPVTNSVYVVHVTDANGCTQKDSVKIHVVHPFQLQLAKEVSICKGESIQLKATGGDLYQWINHTSGLSNTSISNPIASPDMNSIYTLSASDKENCFSDTVRVEVLVHDLPIVTAGQGGIILMGSPFNLKATGSNDIVSWSWSPSKYLNCTDCPAPVATPLESMIYTVKATNSYGCNATDTVSLTMFCNASRIYIPNAFTPNGDGLNDHFSILGQGIGKINSFRIYDRWGTLVFSKSNFKPDDRTGAWDGTIKGEKAPVGSYLYFVEMSCNENNFIQKGTVNLLR